MSTKGFVLDASVLGKAFLDEDQSKEFRAWLDQAMRQREALRAPHLAFSEVGRVIQRTRPDLDIVSRKELHVAVFLGLDVVPLDPAYGHVWTVAEAGLSYYDAEYVALAQATDATLVTADQKQVDAARALKLAVLSFVPASPLRDAPDSDPLRGSPRR